METYLLLLHLTLPHPGPIVQMPSLTHPAVDIACITGDPILSAHGGTTVTYWDGNRGNVVEIVGEGYRSLYAHLDSVHATRSIGRGDLVGRCGSTGRKSLGPHLHLEVGLHPLY